MSKPAVKQIANVVLGEAARPVGALAYSKDGGCEFSAFAYAATWLAAADRFELSPDLALVDGYQYRKAPTKDDSIFHFAFADTEPDGWGCRVIARDHAKQRKAAQAAGKSTVHSAALTEMDYLLCVDDMSRIELAQLIGGGRQCARWKCSIPRRRNFSIQASASGTSYPRSIAASCIKWYSMRSVVGTFHRLVQHLRESRIPLWAIAGLLLNDSPALPGSVESKSAHRFAPTLTTCYFLLVVVPLIPASPASTAGTVPFNSTL